MRHGPPQTSPSNPPSPSLPQGSIRHRFDIDFLIWPYFLGQNSCRTKVSRIFRFFVPDFAPNFALNFPRVFRGFFVLRFVGNGDQKKLTKNPRHFSMQNSQANSKKKSTKCFWRAVKVTILGKSKWGLSDGGLRPLSAICHNRLQLCTFVAFFGPILRGTSLTKFPHKMTIIVGNRGQLWTSTLSPHLRSPHLDFPDYFDAKSTPEGGRVRQIPGSGPGGLCLKKKLKGRQTGGFKWGGGFPDLDLSFLFCPFGDFPDSSGIFPICSGNLRGVSRFVPFLFLGLKKEHLRGTVPKGSATQSGPFPKKVGNPVWKPPSLASLKKPSQGQTAPDCVPGPFGNVPWDPRSS